jgi:hypothetical protein
MYRLLPCINSIFLLLKLFFETNNFEYCCWDLIMVHVSVEMLLGVTVPLRFSRG